MYLWYRDYDYILTNHYLLEARVNYSTDEARNRIDSTFNCRDAIEISIRQQKYPPEKPVRNGLMDSW